MSGIEIFLIVFFGILAAIVTLRFLCEVAIAALAFIVTFMEERRK